MSSIPPPLASNFHSGKSRCAPWRLTPISLPKKSAPSAQPSPPKEPPRKPPDSSADTWRLDCAFFGGRVFNPRRA